MQLPKLIIFASGGKGLDEGGSGFKKLGEAVKAGILRAEIVAVVSNNVTGGVRDKARVLQIPCLHSPKGRTAEDYRRIVRVTEAKFTALSGWLGKVEGLDPRTTFNIHPAWDMVKFGGKNFYGHKVHEAVIAAYKRGEVTFSGISMHFVTPEYDNPKTVFFKRRVPILPDDTADTLAKRVNEMEHKWQAIITDRVVNGVIHWDGVNVDSIVGADIE